jgi:hypothetical protein
VTPAGGAMSSGDIQSGGIYEVCYDGTSFQLMSPNPGTQDVTKYATASEQRQNTATLADHSNGLTGWSFAANTVYAIEGFLSFSGTASQGGAVIALTFTNAPIASTGGLSVIIPAANQTVIADSSDSGPWGSGVGGIPTTQYFTMHVRGTVWTNASTGGTAKLQWAQSTSNANAVTMYAGSWIRFKAM